MVKTKFSRIVALLFAILSLLFFLFFSSQVFNDITLAKEKTTAVVSSVNKLETRTHKTHGGGYRKTPHYYISYTFTDTNGREHCVSPNWSTSYIPAKENDEVILHYNKEFPERVWYTSFTLKMYIRAMIATLFITGICVILIKCQKAE